MRIVILKEDEGISMHMDLKEKGDFGHRQSKLP